MGTTRFSGPVRVGDNWQSATANTGAVVLAQQVILVQNSTAAVTATMALPAGADIIDVIVDNSPAWDSATSATLSGGTAAADTAFMSGVNCKTAGKLHPTFTAAQVIAAPTSTLPKVFFTVTVVGATTTGTTYVTVLYSQAWTMDPV